MGKHWARLWIGWVALCVRFSGKARRRDWFGQVVLDLFRELGATFIKVGQIASTRSDLLPRDLVDELATSAIRRLGKSRPAKNAEHGVVYRNENEFCAWPYTQGFFETGDGKVVYAVPGVPYEMTEMIMKEVLPDLLERSGERAVIVSRSLKTWGASESGLAEMIAERVDQQTNPTIAFLARGIEGIYVRMTAKAATEAEAAAVEEFRIAAVDVQPAVHAVGELLRDPRAEQTLPATTNRSIAGAAWQFPSQS